MQWSGNQYSIFMKPIKTEAILWFALWQKKKNNESKK